MPRLYNIYSRQINPNRLRIKDADDETVTLAAIDELLRKQKRRCAGCGNRPGKQYKTQLTLDHIVPLSHGGAHTIRNIQLLCRSCNSVKKDKLPERISLYRTILLNAKTPDISETVFLLETPWKNGWYW